MSWGWQPKQGGHRTRGVSFIFTVDGTGYGHGLEEKLKKKRKKGRGVDFSLEKGFWRFSFGGTDPIESWGGFFFWKAREAVAGGKTESCATLCLVSFHLLTPCFTTC